MARIRSIKPEMPADRGLARCPIDARYLFVLLITQADDYGLVEAEPRQMLGRLYPHDETITERQVDIWAGNLVDNGLIRWRWTLDGSRVIEIIQWQKHQLVRQPGKPLLRNSLQPISVNPPANLRQSSDEVPQAHRNSSRLERERDRDRDREGGEGSNTSALKRGEEQWVTDFDAVWPLYPRRPNNSRSSALAAYLAARRGHKPKGRPPLAPATAEELRAGVEAYAAYCRRENVGPQFVKLAATFFGPGEHWRTDYGVVEDPTAGFPPEVMACRNPDGTFRLCDDLGNPTAAARWMVR